MKITLIRWFAVLLVSSSFSGGIQAHSPPQPTQLAVPAAIAGFPGATAAWWSGVQAQLQQELGETLSLSAIVDWTAVGEAANNYFGRSVASAGDVNGDGYADLVVGASGYNSGTGKAYVYHGSASGLSATADWSALGEAAGNNFGVSVASAGDVNGDGFADLAVGADIYNNFQGKVYIYLGSAGGLSAAADWSAVGEAAPHRFGGSVASAGDVNGDGYGDLVVGASNYNNARGKAYVYHGSASGLSAASDWTAVGEATNNNFGYSVASVGDVNGDAYADLVVGAYGYNNLSGKAYVYHGSASGLNLSTDWSALGEATFNFFGWSVASAGDVNSDGYTDLAVGAIYSSDAGKAYVYHGSASGLSLTADWSAFGVAAGDLFGVSVASAGDSNGDGYADLAVGAIGFNTTTGKVYVFRGSAGGLNLTANWSVLGEAALDQFGRSVAPAGDVNGDGYADLAVGADANNSATGKAYVFHGSAAPPGCITSCLRVSAIQMQVDSGVVKAIVTVRDENGAEVPRAMVFARWDLPNGGTLNQIKKTNASGLATFIVSRGTGTYTITITNVTKTGYTFDPDNSTILSHTITK